MNEETKNTEELETHHGYDDEYYQHDLSGLMEG